MAKVKQRRTDFRRGTMKEHAERWKEKVTHGHLQMTLTEADTVDITRTIGDWSICLVLREFIPNSYVNITYVL